MLEIENLIKTFGTQTVISDISMTLVSGKIYGLVGRNGSGKTMLMKMILGFVSPSSGSEVTLNVWEGNTSAERFYEKI